MTQFNIEDSDLPGLTNPHFLAYKKLFDNSGSSVKLNKIFLKWKVVVQKRSKRQKDQKDKKIKKVKKDQKDQKDQD